MLHPRLSLVLMALLSGSTSALAQTADDAAYRAATGLLHRDMPEQAATEYRAFLRDHPAHAKAESARYGLAVALARLGQWAGAAAELDKIATKPGFEFAPDVLLLRAQCHLNAKELDGATARLSKLLKEHRGFAQLDSAASMLGEVLASQGRRDEARAVLERFEREWPKSALRPRAELVLAALDAGEGRDAESSERLAKLRREYPGSEVDVQAALSEAQARHRLAVTRELNAREAERASALYRTVVESGNEALVPEGMLGLAQLMRAAGEPAKAGRVLDELTSRFGSSAVIRAAHIERARVHLDEDTPDRALAILEPLCRDGAAGPDAMYWAAKAELRLNRFSAAARRLESAAEKFDQSPWLPEILFDRAVALARDGQAEAAVAAYANVRARCAGHPLAAESLAAEASLALASDDVGKAASLSRAFLEAHPKHPRASSVQLVLAEALSRAGKDEEAARQYAAFVAVNAQDPRAVDAAARRGLALARAGEPEATEILEKALATPGQVEPSLRRAAQSVLADAAIANGNWAAAERWLTELTRQDAAPDALLKLGIAMLRQGRSEEGVALFSRVIEKGSTDAAAVQARFERAQLLVEQGNLDAAKADFEIVTKGDGKGEGAKFRVHALRHLASIASRQDRAEEAAALLAHIADSPEAGAGAADAKYERGAALLVAGKYAEAAEEFGAFMESAPAHPRAADAAAQRAIARARMGRHEEALPALEAAEAGALRPEILAALRYEKAWVLKALGRNGDARSAYERLLAMPLSASLKTHGALDFAQVLTMENQHAAALPILAQAAKAVEKLSADEATALTPSILYLRGVCELKLEKYSDASATLEDLLTRFPKSEVASPAMLIAAQALLKANKPEAAAKRLQTAIDADPPEATLGPALLCLGEAHAAAQQWEASRAAFEQHVKRMPGSEHWFQSQFGIGWALEHLGRHAEAITAYREVVSRHTGATAARAQFQIGECYFATRQFDEAVRELMKVDILYAYPEWSAAALYEAGRCLVQLNKAAEARAQFTQVTERLKDTQWARLAAEQLRTLAAAAPSTLPGRAAAESR